MRIAIIGANGQLGTDLRRRLRGDVVGLDVPEVNVCDPDGVERALREAGGGPPEVVINCAAVTNVDGCEDDPELARRVNADGAANVARAARRLGAVCVYISTDYVFGSQPARRTAYIETDLPGPLSVYGRTKLEGERLTAAACPRSFIVRTCGLYGHAGALGKGGNFVETMCRLAKTDKPIRVVADQTLCPTSTWALAGALDALIRTEEYGLYHVTSPDRCTWHEFASAIVGQISGREVIPIGTDEYPLRARRPAFSALRSVRLCRAGVAELPGWRRMLDEYLAGRSDGVTK